MVDLSALNLSADKDERAGKQPQQHSFLLNSSQYEQKQGAGLSCGPQMQSQEEDPRDDPSYVERDVPQQQQWDQNPF